MKDDVEAQQRLKPNRIVRFYTGVAPDDRGRYLRDILQWPDERLESTHDYIQWLFPLPQASGFNPHAPVLDGATIQEFKSRPDLEQNLRLAFLRMLAFYGLRLETEPELKVEPAQDFEQKSRNWLTYGNHNHLRITRMLKCLRLLGLQSEARSLLRCLARIYEAEKEKEAPGISEETFEFWRKAAGAT
jgi:hypothetical protein